MDKIRVCNVCGAASTAVAFYQGVTSRCAECHKKKMREKRREKVEHYRSYDAARYQNDPRRKEANRAYAKTEAGKATMKRSILKWLSIHPAERAAHVILGNAVRGGKIKKPLSCSLCGDVKGRIHGHHDDYTKPLDVVWCCSRCHTKIHSTTYETSALPTVNRALKGL